MSPKNSDETISKVESMIRVLSKAVPHGDVLDQDDIKALNQVDKEDQPKLADRLEDMIMFLKDEPDNKRKILEIHDTAMDEFGHVKPVRDILESVKTYFLSK
ncbi:MAG: hypothetical protein KGI08_00750 [Thaumarchaeota archaeon]|nr:hypothetical protein [Nitrososphaerota archaeon]